MTPCPDQRRRTVRCAIYTRKSSDEGLEQSFNSLDAQREACSAYIRSQASEGWVESAELYDDGGLSGGTLARPALQRLLADVAVGGIDIIVVYKVDRLTRSLFDFAKLVDQLDAASTSFVSVTQSFNTTTSMGRLTLNMLLSFAQFEREVTAERIRDKIAASKARGMWMGGTPPIGYAPNDRSLEIVPAHAALVRQIYERYLALGTVRKLELTLVAEDVTIPHRVTISGKAIGGGHFTRGHLHQLLRNPVYTGRIAHREMLYEGLHDAIIERPLWDQVQAQLAANLQGERTARVARPSLLAGRIVDRHGEPLVASHACKPARGGTEGQKTRYRYYVSRGLQNGSAETGLRVPAREIESVAVERLAQTLEDPITLMATAWLVVPSHDIGVFSERCRALAQQVRAKVPNLVQQLISQVRIEDGRIVIVCSPASIAAVLDQRFDEQAPETVELTSDVRLTRSGRARRLVDQRGSVVTATPDKALLRLIVQARGWWAELRKGELDIKSLAAREKVAPSYMTRVVRLAFLAPQVVEAIIGGRQANGVTAISLTVRGEWPAEWASQRATMLVSALT